MCIRDRGDSTYLNPVLPEIEPATTTEEAPIAPEPAFEGGIVPVDPNTGLEDPPTPAPTETAAP